MWGARKVTNDPSRFEGEGISFRAKLIGIEDVKESRGDQMCQEAITKLKTAIRIAGAHKRKIIININLQGIKITDAVSLVVLHSHAVPQISFISRDPTDSRAFGYICETEDGLHKFFAIKTATAAEQVVLALKDLFQAVLEAKKKGTEPTKDNIDTGETNASGQQENQQTSENGQASPGSPAADAQQVDQAVAASADSTSPAVNTQSVANLFDFEDQSGSVVQGSQKTRSLELEFLTDEVPPSTSSSATSPLKSVTPSATVAATSTDPWGLAAVETSAGKAPPTNTSALDDLAGIQTSFSSSFSLQPGFGTSASFNPALSAAKDPFGNATFSPFANQPPNPGVPGSQQQSFPAGFTLTNPFGSEFHQPFGMQGVPPRPGSVEAYNMFPGVIPHGVTTPLAMGGGHNPFAAQQNSGLQSGNPFGDSGPNKKDSAADSSVVSPDVLNARAKSPHDDFFSDLLDIKKSSPARAKSPRDMFAQNASADKKSLNDLVGASPRASPVPAALLKPGTSPRASPVPPALLKPGTSPRGSPVPMVPNISASALLLAQNAPLLSPQASSVPVLQDAPTQDSLFDDFFGSPTEHQVAEKSLFG
ncbi:unnamed protein product [Candidula unifasciata]|uniref:PID domain-containing protein n=1 Tax=Candidula unifasciata TaxID=100452 RepID=A0A8S4A7B0_9EUPU|nr:unnamed protein product [Candidula unifasciata]